MYSGGKNTLDDGTRKWFTFIDPGSKRSLGGYTFFVLLSALNVSYPTDIKSKSIWCIQIVGQGLWIYKDHEFLDPS